MEHRADADALALVRRFVARCHPDAEAALLAGSRSRGRGAPGSDYDVILLFGELPNGAWRETSTFEEQVIETFAHDRDPLGARSMTSGRRPIAASSTSPRLGSRGPGR